MAGGGFRELEVWVLAMDLVEEIYRVTAAPPAYRNHVSIALGSQAELETLLEIAARLGLLPTESQVRARDLVRRVGQMLHRLHRSLMDQRDED